MKPPPGYIGHVRDILKGQTTPDPGIVITGTMYTVRVFLMTTRDYNICIDQGEDFRGAERYVSKAIRKCSEDEARRLATMLAMGRVI